MFLFNSAVKTDYEKLWFYRERDLERRALRAERMASRPAPSAPSPGYWGLFKALVAFAWALLGLAYRVATRLLFHFRLSALQLRVQHSRGYISALLFFAVFGVVGSFFVSSPVLSLSLIVGALYSLLRLAFFVGYRPRLLFSFRLGKRAVRVQFPVPYIPAYRRQAREMFWLLSSTYDFLRSDVARGYSALQMVLAFELRPNEGNVPGIYRLDATVPSGLTDEIFVKRVAEPLGSALGLLRVLPLDADARMGFVTLLLCTSSPLDATLPEDTAPVLSLSPEERADPNLWLPVAVDATGAPVSIPFFLSAQGGMRMLQCGISGSGKSSVIRQQLLFAVECPYIDVVITDGKGSEFSVFRPYCENYLAFPEGGVEGFHAQLDFLEGEVARRASALSASISSGADRVSEMWNATDDGNYLLWVWDELGVVIASCDDRDLFGRLFGIVSVARSLGISVVFSSQVFKADILDTKTRGQFPVVVAYKLATQTDAGFVGFDVDSPVSPVAIRGDYNRDGNLSCAGQFVLRGLGKDDICKSWFLSQKTLQQHLRSVLGNPSDNQ